MVEYTNEMKKKFNKIFLLFLSLVIVTAGIFCYQGTQKMNTHCMSESSSMWCGDIAEHGTIISATILATFSLMILPAIFLGRRRANFLFKMLSEINLSRGEPKILRWQLIITPFKQALKRGIIHPSIP